MRDFHIREARAQTLGDLLILPAHPRQLFAGDEAAVDLYKTFFRHDVDLSAAPNHADVESGFSHQWMAHAGQRSVFFKRDDKARHSRDGVDAKLRAGAVSRSACDNHPPAQTSFAG